VAFATTYSTWACHVQSDANITPRYLYLSTTGSGSLYSLPHTISPACIGRCAHSGANSIAALLLGPTLAFMRHLPAPLTRDTHGLLQALRGIWQGVEVISKQQCYQAPGQQCIGIIWHRERHPGHAVSTARTRSSMNKSNSTHDRVSPCAVPRSINLHFV
jgi:hypothetical protein